MISATFLFVLFFLKCFGLNYYVEKIGVRVILRDGNPHDTTNSYITHVIINIGGVEKTNAAQNQVVGVVTWNEELSWDSVTDSDIANVNLTVVAWHTNRSTIDITPYKRNIKSGDPIQTAVYNLSDVINGSIFTLRMDIIVECTLIACESRDQTSGNCLSYLDLDSSVCVRNGSKCSLSAGDEASVVCEGRRGSSKEWDWPCGKSTESPPCYLNAGASAYNGGTRCATNCSNYYVPDTNPPTGTCVRGSPCLRTEQLKGGTVYSSSSQTGSAGGGYEYEIWNNGGTKGNITIYGVDAAFRADWNESGDFLARVGLKWGAGSAYDTYGDIIAEYSYRRSGTETAGDYSYIGIYGWTRNPLVEYYIVDDWFGNQWQNDGSAVGPSTICYDLDNPDDCYAGEFIVDDDVYVIYKHVQKQKPSIDGNSDFTQYYSVRQKTRQCGTIHVSEHFKKWEQMGMKMGNMYEAKILVEAGGQAGFVDYSYALITAGAGGDKK